MNCAKRLNEVAHKLFDGSNLLVSIAGSDECVMRFWQCAGITAGTGKSPAALKIPKPEVRNEAFIVPTDVCYASHGLRPPLARRALHRRMADRGARAFLRLPVERGARERRRLRGGLPSGAQRATVRFYSYRDPHLDETLERFNGTPAWLAAFDPAPEEMDGYVVSTVAGFDAPLKERMQIRRQDGDFLSGRTPEARAQTRAEMIGATPEKLRELAGVIEGALGKEAVCVFGNKAILEGAKTDLDVIDLLNG